MSKKLFYTALLKTTAVIAAVVFTTLTLVSMAYSDDINKGLSSSVIRLHVVANSDSPEDQQLKRDVRDAVLAYMRNELKDCDDVTETEDFIKERIGVIENIAKEEIQRQGSSYPVKAQLGCFPFPTKSYGDVTLPAGSYKALKIVIGKGDGDNWWCVLFPPLCFVDATHGTLPQSVKDDLKKVLTEEEYSIVTSAGTDDDIPVRLKFKIVEFLQKSKIEFNGLLSGIFKTAR
jgi:stage II sporulation protein R